MNHYKHHIGDWMKDTAHLSACEEGIYGRLIQQSYSREGPLPADLKTCQKLARANTKAEREAVTSCLSEFFTQGADGWHQKRCDKEIAEYQVKASRNREVGTLGGRPPNSVRNVSRETQPTGPPEITQTVSGNNPEITQVVPKNNPSHKPVTNSQEKKTDLSGKPDLSAFEDWYSAYPRHEAKSKAQEAWKRLNGSVNLPLLLAAVEVQKRSGCLQPRVVDGRSTIPLPATWLNGKRWQDEVKAETNSGFFSEEAIRAGH